MTKEEAFKLLSNVRVYVGTKSEEIQKKLFELGFSWCGEKIVQHLNEPFFYVNPNGNIQFGSLVITFNKSAYREMSVEEILSIKIDEKHTFKPFDKVLVRNASNDIWRCSLYSHTINNTRYPYACVSGNHPECIPFEGNEHLVGTCNYSC